MLDSSVLRVASLLGVFLPLGACGCGGSSSKGDDADTGAASTTGGASTIGGASSGGGTSGALAPPARGAASFVIVSCQQYTGGIALDGNVPTSSFPGDRLEDGQEGTSVSCRVPAGPPFEISGRIEGANNHPSATFPGEPVEFELQGGIIGETGTGTASVSIFAGQVYRSQTANPCTLSVVSSPSLEVATGRIFATFNCTQSLDVAGSPTTDCSANGVFVFEGCQEE